MVRSTASRPAATLRRYAWPGARQPADQAAIDQAYLTKYSRYDAAIVNPMVAPAARAATLQLLAR